MTPSFSKPSVDTAPQVPLRAGRWGALAALVGIVIYLVLYLWSEPIRGYALLRLFVPDDLVREWGGNDLSRVGLADRLPILLEVAAIQGLAVMAGRRLLNWTGAMRGLDRLERAVFAYGVGMNAWSLYTLGIGLLGQLQQPWLFWGPAVGLILISLWESSARWRRASSAEFRAAEPWGRADAAGVAAGRENAGSGVGRLARTGTSLLGNAPQSAWRTMRGTRFERESRKTSGQRAANRLVEPGGTAPSRPAEPAWPGWLPRLLILLSIPFVLLLILEGMLPPWHFDTREYHLQVPKEWYQAGVIGFMPHNVYGNMPLGAEMQVILGIVFWPGTDNWWWGALVGKTAISSVAIWTAIAIYAAGRRFFSSSVGTFAAFTYLSTPWVIYVSVSGLIDGVSAFYSLLTCYALALWKAAAVERSRAEQPPQPDSSSLSVQTLSSNLADPTGSQALDSRSANSPLHGGELAWERRPQSDLTMQSDGPANTTLQSDLRLVDPPGSFKSMSTTGSSRPSETGYLLLAGFLAGAAVACKYPAVLFLVVPALALVIGWPWRVRTAWSGLVFTLALLAGCGLWFVKNAVLTGNPTYPLLYEVFGGTTRTPEKARQWSQAHQTPRTEKGLAFSLRDLQKSLRLLTLSSDFLSPLIWPLALLGLAAAYRDRRVLWLAGLILFTLVCWWAFTHRVDRFLLPILPQASLLAGLGVQRYSGRLWQTSMLVFLLISCLINGLLAASRFSADNRMFVSLSDLRTDLPRETDRGWTRIHPIIRYLNEHVRAGDRVLVVGEAQVFDLEVPAIYNTCFDDCVFEQRFRDRSAEARRATLAKDRITYVFVNWRELDRYREPGNYGYSDYVTRSLIRDELVREQGLLRPVELDVPPENSELFEVVGDLRR